MAACAHSPEKMAQESNFEVCRFTMGGPWSGMAQQEAQRRSLDCTAYYPGIAAQQANQNAAVQNYLRATQPRAVTPVAPVGPVVCRSRRVGNQIETVCD